MTLEQRIYDVQLRLYHVEVKLDSVLSKFDSILVSLQNLKLQGTQIMVGMVDVLKGVKEERTLIDSMGQLMKNLHDQLAALIASGGLDQAALDEAFATIEANKAAMVQDLADNTPAAGVQ